MAAVHHLASAGLSAASAVVLASVGRLILRRPVAVANRGALVAFATWWFGAGSVLALVSVQGLMAAGGIKPAGAYVALNYAVAFPLAIALGGLLYYLAYLYTGQPATRVPIIAYCVGFLMFVLYYYSALGPWQVEIGTWQIRFISSDPREPSWARVYGLLLAGPVIVGALAYATLLFRTRESALRYRIGLVSSAFFLLFGFILLGFLLRLYRFAWFTPSYQVAGLVASFLVFLAYRPPQRWGRFAPPKARTDAP